MATTMNEPTAGVDEGISHRVTRRAENRRATADPGADSHELVELACECTKVDCDRMVKVPFYVYRRMLDADHYLLQAGHHAFAQYRTIISVGLMRVEERG